MILWVTAASLWAHHSNASFAIIAILAVTAQIISVNSARREGLQADRKRWIVDRILDEVGDRGRRD